MSKQTKIICGFLALIIVFFVLILVVYIVKKNNQNYPKPASTINLKSLDSDKDGLSDYEEIYTYKTDPNDKDTDDDGYFDGQEVQDGSDPLSWREDITIGTPFDKEIYIKETAIEIKGGYSKNIEYIEFEISNDKNGRMLLSSDNCNRTEIDWTCKFGIDNAIPLVEGRNIFVATAYRKNGTAKEVERIINVEIVEKIASGIIKVDWDDKLLELKGESGNDYEIFYKAGVVAEGEYKGLLIYLKSVEEGPGGPTFSHVMIKDGKKISLEENEVKIEGLFNYPDKITIPGENYSLTKGLVAYKLFSDENKLALFKNNELGNFYDDGGCAIAELPDHTTISYNFTLPFDVNEITFLDGRKNTENYRYEKDIKGCGPICSSFEYVGEDKLMPDKRLIVAGKTKNEKIIYKIGDQNDNVLKSFYDTYVNSFSNSYETPNDSEKRSYEEFLKLHPFLYWKDSFGRWIEFINTRFVATPQAEMCKPAIYLYPENKAELNVQVSPNGGFTYTNPPYGNGWNVEASPNGRIKNLKSGKEYNYLYWEGKGLNYPIKEEGWVIKKENLEKFFDEKLSLIGLNDKEMGDFKEYWLKQLSAKPYYQISFLTQSEFNRLAPISFSPKSPETLIRVMMTARGLNETKNIQEQHLPPTPKRNGFTAVEWGGTLLR